MSFSFESAFHSILIELWATYSTANLTDNPEALERLRIPVGINTLVHIRLSRIKQMEEEWYPQSHCLVLFYYHYRTSCIFDYSRCNTPKQHIFYTGISSCSDYYELDTFRFCILYYCCLNRHLTIDNLLF